MNEKERFKLLVEIILDPTARDHEKDDAAMDLAEYDDENDEALQALVSVSQDPSEEDLFALEAYGETIAIYWARKNYFPVEVYKTLKGKLRAAVYSELKYSKPEWVEKYQLYQYGFQDDEIGKT